MTSKLTPKTIAGSLFPGFLKEHKFLFLTYLVMIFIPLFAFITCIFNTNSIMRKDAHQYQSSILDHEKSICDNLIHSAKTAVTTAALEPGTRHLQKETVFSPDSMLLVSKLSAILSDLKNSYSCIDSLGVYFCSNNSFVTDAKRYAPAIYDAYLAKYNLSVETFIGQTTDYTGYLLLSSETQTWLLLYQNLYDYSLKKRTAVTYAIIPWTAVAREIRYLEMAKGEVLFLLDQNNTLFGCSDDSISRDSLPDYETLVQHSGAGGDVFLNSPDGTALISGVASDELDLYYGMYLLKNRFYREVNLLIFKYCSGLAVSILTGVCVAFYFTKKYSAPVTHLLSLIDDSQRKNTSIVLSESYRRLEETLLTLLKDNRRLSRQVYFHNETVFEMTLSGFLKGIYPNEDWILEFHDSEPELCGIDDYQVVLFHFTGIESCKFIRLQRESRESYSLLVFSLKNVIDEAFLRKGEKDPSGVSIFMDNTIMCLLPACRDEDGQNLLISRADTCIDFFQKLFELDCCVAVSSPHTLWTELSEAYEEAYMTMAHTAFWKDGAAVSFYSAGAIATAPDGSRLLLLKKKLSNALIVNNYAMAEELIGEITETCFLHDIQYFTYNQCQAYALISMLLDKLSDTGMNAGIKTAYSSRLLHAHSTEELKQVILDIFGDICDYHSENSTDDAWAESIKQYIRDNYSLPELNVTYIAEHFSVSAAHIGNRFRKLTGTGILDYVHMVRLTRCKELLEKGCTIKDCVSATGYTDIKTLQRAFKRYEGLPPGQYKETNRKNSG